MAVIKTIQGPRTALTVTGLTTLASANYVQSADYDCTVNQPVDVVIEGNFACSGTPSGNKQVLIFAQVSLDGGNYQSGPVSGSSSIDEADLSLVGAVPLNSNTSTHRKAFSLFQALGFMPQHVKLVIKNDAGVALTAGAIYTAEQSTTVA